MLKETAKGASGSRGHMTLLVAHSELTQAVDQARAQHACSVVRIHAGDPPHNMGGHEAGMTPQVFVERLLRRLALAQPQQCSGVQPAATPACDWC